MRCFHPWVAWQRVDGSITTFESGSDLVRQLELPCGQCIGCKLKRAESWAVRMVHESRMHDANCFITLTYNDESLPQHGSLYYPHFQSFMRRLRKSYGKVRFFMGAEYGEGEFRPHYHACLFGLSFAGDRKVRLRSDSGFDVYESKALSALWPHGYASVGDFSFESAGYVARYVVKKVTGDLAAEHYKRVDVRTGEVVDVVPEFCRCSLRPGIGKSFFEKYKDEILVRDACVIGGIARAVPRYYDKVLREIDGFRQDEVEYDRYLERMASTEVINQDRLDVQEQVTKARLDFKKRGKV